MATGKFRHLIPADTTVDRWHRPFRVMARLDRATGINTLERAVARSSRAMTLPARVNGNDSWYYRPSVLVPNSLRSLRVFAFPFRLAGGEPSRCSRDQDKKTAKNAKTREERKWDRAVEAVRT
jgi:hypothetical protein